MANDEIILYLEHSDELRQLFADIISLKNGLITKDALLMFAGVTKEETNKIDSDYPVDYGRSIANIYPEFYKGRMCYSYLHKSGGEMLNINNLIAERVLKPL